MKWTTILTEQLDKLKADAARADRWEAIAEKYMELFFKARAAVESPSAAAALTPLCGFSGCCLAAKWRITWDAGDAFAYACTNHLGAMLGDEDVYEVSPLPLSPCVE